MNNPLHYLNLVAVPVDWSLNHNQSEYIKPGKYYLWRSDGFWHAGRAGRNYHGNIVMNGWMGGYLPLGHADFAYELPDPPEKRKQYIIKGDQSEYEEDEE